MKKPPLPPGVIETIHTSDLIIICPSNPWVSIDPILAIPGIRPAVESKPVIAVSPIIGGQAVKGPAAKMFTELGISPSALALAEHNQSLFSGLLIDAVDRDQAESIRALNITPFITQTLMKSSDDRRRLASQTMEFAHELLT